jgi:hypothetical protein
MKYQFLNLQPLGYLVEDCVCRAISYATCIPYEKIQYKLYLTAEIFECEELCVCCYKHLLDNVFNLERVESYHGLTVEKFINLNPEGTFIIRVEGHLTACKDGILKDTWDCRGEIVDIVWKI